MSNIYHKKKPVKIIIISSIISMMTILGLTSGIFLSSASAQSNIIQANNPQIVTNRHNVAPKPKHKPNMEMPTRYIERVGTAIGVRNSISIKSTDAGIIPPYHSYSGCINCGVVESVNVVGQGGHFDAITGGIIGGTIARKIGRHGSNQQNGNNNPNQTIHYDVGVNMDDGHQTILTLPNEPAFNSGDRVRLIDGVLVPNR